MATKTVKAAKAKRSGLGGNPLDAIVPKAVPTAQAEQPSSSRTRYTLNLPEDLIERAKNASWAVRRPLTAIAEHGLRAELAKLEKENGGPFPPRPGNLPAGRPLS